MEEFRCLNIRTERYNVNLPLYDGRLIFLIDGIKARVVIYQ